MMERGIIMKFEEHDEKDDCKFDKCIENGSNRFGAVSRTGNSLKIINLKSDTETIIDYNSIGFEFKFDLEFSWNIWINLQIIVRVLHKTYHIIYERISKEDLFIIEETFGFKSNIQIPNSIKTIPRLETILRTYVFLTAIITSYYIFMINQLDLISGILEVLTFVFISFIPLILLVPFWRNLYTKSYLEIEDTKISLVHPNEKSIKMKSRIAKITKILVAIWFGLLIAVSLLLIF